MTIRQLLRHTADLGGPNGPPADENSYAGLQTIVESGPYAPWIGKWHYFNGDYALLRILLPYLVDGPAAYGPFEGQPTLNAQITALSYRNYVRGRIFAPLGLSAVDEFHTGPLPETIYFDGNLAPIPDKLNVPGSGYNQTADYMVLTAGAGNWHLSAEEYSWFISNLWLGHIVSASSVMQMVGQDDQTELGVPDWLSVCLGTYGARVGYEYGGLWDYAHNGGGSTWRSHRSLAHALQRLHGRPPLEHGVGAPDRRLRASGAAFLGCDDQHGVQGHLFRRRHGAERSRPVRRARQLLARVRCRRMLSRSRSPLSCGPEPRHV